MTKKKIAISVKGFKKISQRKTRFNWLLKLFADYY